MTQSIQKQANGSEKFLERYSISLMGAIGLNQRCDCPVCQEVESLAVTFWSEMDCEWRCTICDHEGSNADQMGLGDIPEKDYIKPDFEISKPTQETKDNFFSRQVLNETVLTYGCEFKAGVYKFPYIENGEVVNVITRSKDEQKETEGAKSVFFNIDNIGEEIVICSREVDAMIAIQAGKHAVSVPPTKNGFSYIDNAFASLRGCKLILALYQSKRSEGVAEEIVRRFDSENCSFVKYPADCLSLEDIAANFGTDEVASTIDNAEFAPVNGIYSVGSLWEGTMELLRNPLKKGYSTGYPLFDEILTVNPQDVWIVTGSPGSGKSEFLDALTVNLAKLHGFKTAVCSFENIPEEHLGKMIEKVTGESFMGGYGHDKMTETIAETSKAFLMDHYHFIRFTEDAAPSIDWVLDRAKTLIKRFGINAIIIDPYNELATAPVGVSETDFVSDMLGKVRRFCHKYKVNVFFVAHPKKMGRDSEGNEYIPTLYDISGSANWNNKADVGLVIQRLPDFRVRAHVRKVRRKHIGTQGTRDFLYTPRSGTYEDIPSETDSGALF